MFVRRIDDIYILYKIDALNIYRSSKSNNLLPLIIFENDILPDCQCLFAYTESNLYIFGQNKNNVFTLKRGQLLRIDPSKNYRYLKFLKNFLNLMNTVKPFPLAFDYDGKLYVLSRTTTFSFCRLFNF